MHPDPMQFSAATMRLAGMMIENQMRVAKVFGDAAIASNPFLKSMAPLKAFVSATSALPGMPSLDSSERVEKSIPKPKKKAVVKRKKTSVADPAKPVVEAVVAANADEPAAPKPKTPAKRAPSRAARRQPAKPPVMASKSDHTTAAE